MISYGAVIYQSGISTATIRVVIYEDSSCGSSSPSSCAPQYIPTSKVFGMVDEDCSGEMETVVLDFSTRAVDEGHFEDKMQFGAT